MEHDLKENEFYETQTVGKGWKGPGNTSQRQDALKNDGKVWMASQENQDSCILEDKGESLRIG